MAYLINNYNGTPLVNVQDRTVDITATSLKLPGRDYRPYGETMVENLVYMLQHFAQGVSPTNPISGQIWFDTTAKTLKVYDQTTLSWLSVGSPQSGPTQLATGVAGQIFYNTAKRQLFVWDADAGPPSWRLVGPVGAFDNTDPNSVLPTHSAWEVVQILDASPSPTLRTVWRLSIAGELMAVMAKETFNANISGFTNPIQQGINLRTNYKFVGQATSAVTASVSTTQPANNSSNLIATTQFVTNAVSSKANVSGNSAQSFEVANAVTNTQAVNLGQLNSAIPVGCMMEYGGSSAPSGWLLCDGSQVGRTAYAALFAVISTSYGTGNGTTTFNLPDRRGRFGIGANGTYTLGSGGGSMTSGGTVLTGNQMPIHTHTSNNTSLTGTFGPFRQALNTPDATGSGVFSRGTVYASGDANNGTRDTVEINMDATHSHIIANAGGSDPHDHTITPPYVASNYIIKV